MGIDKSRVMKLFQKDPQKYWYVSLFDRGYERRQCKCGRFFWTTDPDRKTCGDPPCDNYSFIGNPPGKKKRDIIKSWSTIRKFFEKNGHTAVNRYPVVCRWFPGLYFTVASIVDFQRSTGGKTVFELPANPLVVPQPCLRFPDIPNIGVSGRHMSSFTMVGQHSVYSGEEGYWKDECIRLDHELLTKEFGIPDNDITWLEDIWAGPNAFGASIEYYARGLEVGNAVFTEFVGTVDNYSVMGQKVIDMGAGLERFAWLSQGTPTAYDANFGPVLGKMKKSVDYDGDFFLGYASLSGAINADERDMAKAKANVARAMGISAKELDAKTAPVEAMYAIADHARTMAYAISDGGLPSNVGGGYNLRVILRRAFNLIDKYGFPFDVVELAEQHSAYLKPIYPDLVEHVDEMNEIISFEKKKYAESKAKARRIVRSVIDRGRGLSTELMAELYDSNGITPELISEVASQEGKAISIPTDFYAQVTERHMQKESQAEQEALDVFGI
ncbi:MAG: alanine--tRNA ligase, partial [Candidatus Diapherotrites archaeon]|nr:alanine--tRNA ligase [Candidatus Diapherotrites archaeon]